MTKNNRPQRKWRRSRDEVLEYTTEDVMRRKRLATKLLQKPGEPESDRGFRSRSGISFQPSGAGEVICCEVSVIK